MSVDTRKVIQYDAYFETVRRWPTMWRFNPVQDLLDTLAVEMGALRPRHRTLPRALGLLATDRPAPSDADIRQWLGERRMEKYG